MAKFLVHATFTTHAYVEVEAINEATARAIADADDDGNWTYDTDYDSSVIVDVTKVI
jgi:hypothetical protein